ncbi:fungal zn(2)-Cys(6) binuclear cluster domain-containing protein [Purpureocillium lilacinum]|uniref:Fungal zn(2)-Cys(6) binuclear cluster domain-containing protein n=1 Tax=Purpureocillium lilacinum TaxID=33203 RepID=A0A179GQV7_PURLI|nr:fungal zn(2)-Cys(6) binuclear cluster domain-containing protein [Purpureocillium lilacinum]
MFGTWKYDPETDQVQNLRRAYDPITARSSQHQACNRCHEKKLKCSGDKDGCDRCAASGHTCEYSRSNSRKGRKGSVNSKEGRSHSREESGSPSSRASSHKGQSQAKSKSGRSRDSGSALALAAHTGQHHHGSSAGHTSSRMVSPTDAFDMSAMSTGMTSDMYGSPTMSQFDTSHYSAYQQGGWSGFDDAANAVVTTAMDSTYVATTSPMYGNEYGAYDAYQGYQYPNMDQRYWPQ